ncbi:MAG: M42 family metallopeptidase [bacterium]
MHKESVDFLKQLIGIASPSGFEWGIQSVLKKRMVPFCDEVRTDVHGNVIGVINPKAPVRVMLSGHCDEIGLMIVHVEDRGFLSFAAIGGIDPSVMDGQRVNIHSAKGSVFGVIGRKPIHMMEPDERGKPLKLHELWIDIGAKNRKEALKHVSVGDYVTINVGLEKMLNNLVAGRGFDDRAGAFVVVETLRRLEGRKVKVGVYGVTSVQEEIGLRGARTSAFGIDPHVGIAVDVGFASDYPGGDAKRTGECKLGKGPTLHRGPNINPVLARLMEASARKHKVPFQVTAEPSATGTDANAMQVNRLGVATALVSIPNRYMHTAVEVISLDDLDACSRLLADFITDMDPGQKYIPGMPATLDNPTAKITTNPRGTAMRPRTHVR